MPFRSPFPFSSRAAARTACAAVGTLWRYLLDAGSEVNEKARLISLKHSRTCISVILTYGILPKPHHRRTRRADPRGRPLPCGIPLCDLSIIPRCRLVNTFIKLIAKLKTKHFYGIKCTNLRKTKAFSVRFIKNAQCPVFYPDVRPFSSRDRMPVIPIGRCVSWRKSAAFRRHACENIRTLIWRFIVASRRKSTRAFFTSGAKSRIIQRPR